MKNLLITCVVVAYLQTPIFAQNDTLCILQLNDVYEIGALDQGKVGGMSRVATLVKQHEARYQTFVVLAGDFVSPSVIGTTKIKGRTVYGSQMVDIMNKVGVDLVTFGNHEFDIPETELQQRINESQFSWISSDVQHVYSDGSVSSFYRTSPDSVKIPTSYLLRSSNGQFSVGIISATIPSNPESWVKYNPVLESMKNACMDIKGQTDVIIALTHLSLAEDEEVLNKLNPVRLIMGGHEHKNNYVRSEDRAIAKADANAKTIYRHLLFREGNNGQVKIVSELLPVDSLVQPDPEVAAAVRIWEDRAYAFFRQKGLEPNAVVYHTIEPLDGTEASVRYKQTNLGKIITQAMRAASPQADGALFNSGSIRIDDMIVGAVTQLDIIRTLPFESKLCEVEMNGTYLTDVLVKGNSLVGLGGYLQESQNFSNSEGNWMINGKLIDPLKIYTLVAPEYLFSGNEKGFEFLKDGNPSIKITRFNNPGEIHADLRLAVVKYLSGLGTP